MIRMTLETWVDWRGASEPLLPGPPRALAAPFQRRQAPERLSGRWDRACFAAWSLYCHVHGTRPQDDEQMRRALARMVRRPLQSRRELSMGEWRRCAEELGTGVAARDGGFHQELFGHCPSLQHDRRLWPAAYGALLGFTEPCELAGVELETWVAVLAHLVEHQREGCPGFDDCSVLARAEAMLSGRRRAA